MNSIEVYINWRAIIQLCDRVNAERDGDVERIVQELLKQLVRHFQSGNERQALQAFAVWLIIRYFFENIRIIINSHI